MVPEASVVVPSPPASAVFALIPPPWPPLSSRPVRLNAIEALPTTQSTAVQTMAHTATVAETLASFREETFLLLRWRLLLLMLLLLPFPSRSLLKVTSSMMTFSTVCSCFLLFDGAPRRFLDLLLLPLEWFFDVVGCPLAVEGREKRVGRGGCQQLCAWGRSTGHLVQ